MSESQAAPAMPDNAASSGSAPSLGTPNVKFAGKFDSPDALVQGVREAHKLLGLDPIPDDNTVYGEKGFVKDVTAAETYYKNLDKMISKGLHKAPAASTDTPKLPSNPNATPEEAMAKAGFTRDALIREYVSGGDLSETTYAKLEASGVARDAVKAKITEVQTKAWADGEAAAGSKEEHERLRQWAEAGNIKGAAAGVLKTMSMNPDTYGQAVAFIKEQFEASNGFDKSGSAVSGSHASPSSGGAITSISEFSKIKEAAMNGDSAALERIRKTPLKNFTGF